MEKQVQSERMNRINEVHSHLRSIQEHAYITLQQSYFKCAYECVDRRRKHKEISNCVDQCRVSDNKAQQHVDNEMAKFRDRLKRSIKMCMDKSKIDKLQQKTGRAYELGSCVDASIQESLNTLPHLANKLKASINITS